MLGTNGISAADIAAVTGNNNGFGGEGGWWAILLILALYGGYGFGGMGGFGMGGMFPWMMGFPYMGGYGYGGAPVTNGDLQRGFDTQSIITKLNGLENGLCSLGYDQLAQMNGINNNITNSGYNVERAIQANAIADMQNQFGIINAIGDAKQNCSNNYRSIAEQLTQCCCDNEKIALQNRYDAAAMNCQTLQAIDKLGDRIVDRINQSEISAKDAKIAEQACLINNQYLLSQINKTPVPAYVVQNPYCNCHNGYPFGFYGAGTTVA